MQPKDLGSCWVTTRSRRLWIAGGNVERRGRDAPARNAFMRTTGSLGLVVADRRALWAALMEGKWWAGEQAAAMVGAT